MRGPADTPRLRLRRWREEDLAPFAAMNADARVMEHMPGVMSVAETEALLARIEAHFEAEGFGLWAVERRDSGAFIGYVGLLRVPFEAHFTPAVEIGWRLGAAHWGAGFATEAARVVLDYAFETLGLEEVVSFTAVVNTRSWRVMERLGMTHDAAEDFDHPRLEAGHPLRRHVLYRIRR